MMARCWSLKHKMKTFERTSLNESLKVYELHPTGALLAHPLTEWKPCHTANLRARPRIFGLIISKSTQRLGACGGQISPGSTRRLEDLAKGSGPDVSQGHPFVGQGRNARRSGSTQDRINSSSDGPTDSSNIHSSNPTFPRCILRHRNWMAISR